VPPVNRCLHLAPMLKPLHRHLVTLAHFPAMRLGLLLLCLLPSSGAAGPIRLEVTALLAQVSRSAPDAVAQAVPSIMESTRAKVLAALARGDVPGAIAAYEVHAGSKAPEWLRALQTAFSAKSQEAGKCQDVARILHQAYSKLGRATEFIAFRANANHDYITFDSPGGKIQTLTHTGYHAAVRSGDLIYDAYTGPIGMKMSEYLARLSALEGISWTIVSAP
jgi:hypothetical protein